MWFLFLFFVLSSNNQPAHSVLCLGNLLIRLKTASPNFGHKAWVNCSSLSMGEHILNRMEFQCYPVFHLFSVNDFISLYNKFIIFPVTFLYIGFYFSFIGSGDRAVIVHCLPNSWYTVMNSPHMILLQGSAIESKVSQQIVHPMLLLNL